MNKSLFILFTTLLTFPLYGSELRPTASQPPSDQGGDTRLTALLKAASQIRDQSPISILEQRHTRTFKCYFCDEHFPQRIRLEQHKKDAHEGERYSCFYGDCSKSYALEKSLNHHVRTTHLNIKPFQCDMCERKFPSQKGLDSHRKTHTHTFKCSRCNIKFEKENERDEHQKTHPEKPSIYFCPSCDQTCKYEHQLLAHIREVHRQERRFKCDYCDMKFYRKLTLQRHMNTHNAEASLLCPSCPLNFTREDTLKNHIKAVHKGERPFRCDDCGKSFARHTALKLHISRVHDKERPFTCSTCRKSFSSKQRLSIHINTTHNGEKAFQCPYCSKVYKHRQTRNKHIKKVHEAESIIYINELKK